MWMSRRKLCRQRDGSFRASQACRTPHSRSQRMAVNADANRRLAPANAQLVEPEEDPDTAEQNKSQPMRVWPGLKLIGAGGAIKKGTFVTVAACGDNIALESGTNRKSSQARRALPTRSPTRQRA